METNSGDRILTIASLVVSVVVVSVGIYHGVTFTPAGFYDRKTDQCLFVESFWGRTSCDKSPKHQRLYFSSKEIKKIQNRDY
jgi:hypothetical protein